MGKGYLQIELRTGDLLPVKNAKVLIKDTNGSIINELITDENGLTKQAALEAPDIDESYGHSAHFAIYDVEVPYVYNYKMEIIHGVQIFDKISSNLPIRMVPKVTGEPPETNIDEIFIPKEHGVDYQRAEQSVQSNVDIMQAISANDIKIPEYITVHLGSPNIY